MITTSEYFLLLHAAYNSGHAMSEPLDSPVAAAAAHTAHEVASDANCILLPVTEDCPPAGPPRPEVKQAFCVTHLKLGEIGLAR